jgi:hypothetical protein
MLDKFGKEMKEMVTNVATELKKSKSVQPSMPIDQTTNKSVMKKMVTVMNLDNNQNNVASNDNSTAELIDFGQKKIRSGKELWAIARKLTYEKNLA